MSVQVISLFEPLDIEATPEERKLKRALERLLHNRTPNHALMAIWMLSKDLVDRGMVGSVTMETPEGCVYKMPPTGEVEVKHAPECGSLEDGECGVEP